VTTHLLIPDAHARPNESLDRFEWLGRLILDELPDVIIDIGDWWDMESLCSYDKGTKSFEGRRYKHDIEAGHKADELAFGPIIRYNSTRSRHKKAQYNPTIVRTRGNHEQRIAKAIERQPELEGAIGLADTAPRLDLNWALGDFLKPIVVDSISYCHYYVSGIMGRPVSSARALVAKHHMSCTMGHSHTRDWAEGVRADGVRMQGLICGAFHDPDHDSSYAGPSQNLWWNGVHIKRGVVSGNYDREEISVERLRERYS
jgi:hypothetical protein